MKKIGSFFTDAGNATREFVDKSRERVISAVDKNGDGRFDMEDVSEAAEAVSRAARHKARAIKEKADESRKLMDLKSLRPVFPETLDQTDFLMSKLIQVVDRDKKYRESNACQGAIGFLTDKMGLRVVNVFKDSLSAFGLSFYPDCDCGFFYVNPSDRDNYISLEKYFSYLQMVRINELQRVAQDLGARYFKVTYAEESRSFSDIKDKVQVRLAPIGGITGQHDSSEKKYSRMDVVAEMHMDGHLPLKPQLVYLLKDDNVQNLIHLRMNGGTGFHSHKFTIKMSNTSGIKIDDAVKIDAFLKLSRAAGNASFAREAKNESHRYLEYEIEF